MVPYKTTEEAQPIPIYRHKSGAYILVPSGKYRINREIVVEQTYNRLDEACKIFTGEITRIDDGAHSTKISGYVNKTDPSDTLTSDQYVDNRNSYCIDYCDGNPIFNSREQRELYDKFISTYTTNYIQYDSSTELTYQIIDIVHDIDGSYEPVWHSDITKINFFKFNRNVFAISYLAKVAAKYGVVFTKDNKNTSSDVPTYSYGLNGLRFLKIDGKYYGNDSMNYSNIIGHIDECKERENAIKTAIDDIFHKWYISKYPIDNITIGSLLNRVDIIITQASKIRPRVSNKSEYGWLMSSLRELNQTLIMYHKDDII